MTKIHSTMTKLHCNYDKNTLPNYDKTTVKAKNFR